MAINEAKLQRLDKIAGNHHHLLGTKAILGVLKKHDSEPPDDILTETLLKNSVSIQKIYNEIGKNIHGIHVKPVCNYITKDDKQKLVQGPFLVLFL